VRGFEVKVFRSRFRFQAAILLALLLAFSSLYLSGCGPSGEKTAATSKGQSQTIRISGAWALYPMMVRWAEEYKKGHADIRIDISAGGAGKGVADALAGLTDIGMVSRDIKPEEIKQGAFFLPVVKDAVFPVMNARNVTAQKITQERGLTKKAFLDLWINGLTVSWEELARTGKGNPVQVYTRSDSCGAAETWAAYLDGRKQEDLKGIAVYGDPGLADAIRKDASGIGYNNLNYAFDMKTGLPVEGLLVIPIDVNGNGKVDPEEVIDTKEKAMKAVVAGVYPSPPARDLYIITKDGFRGPSKNFVAWILTEGQKYVAEAGYIGLKPSQLTEGMGRLSAEQPANKTSR
jgi:phosphate transport system substrate-binding protein